MGKYADIHLLLLKKYPADVGPNYESAIFLLNNLSWISVPDQHPGSRSTTKCNYLIDL